MTASSVTRFNVRGTISGSRIIGRRTLEVLFDPMASGAHALGVRSYVLSTDGAELHEMEGGKVLMSRRRCQSAAS